VVNIHADPRLSVLQHFKENQFFSNTVLKKEYKYAPPASAADDKPDENGITDAMLDFAWGEHVKITVSSLA
jgi:template-activating factor I